jgi:HEAT repeat protein
VSEDNARRDPAENAPVGEAGGAGAPAEPASETGSADANPRLAARLFVLPAIVGGIIVLILGLYFLFSALTRETRSADAYLTDVVSGSGNRRWQAAYELSSLLESGQADIRSDTASKTLKAFEDARANEDPRVRRYLALALGRLKDPAAVPALAGALSDPDAETRIYAALALGKIGARQATAPLVGALDDEDSGVRKAIVYALGQIQDPESSDALRQALHDSEIDVTWNAAVALARMGDPSGAEVLRAMADREFVERASQSTDPAARSTVIITAIQGLVMISDTAGIPAIRKLASSDPDLAVRQAALEGLKKLEGAAGAGAAAPP